ncbi:NHL domain-containing thioredoxin family protein [Couchioplanes caeruleus]|uniref:Alkyl hydroperoxide reductase n=2 Tax=Couchioplanes caeruleus TaxID=56438 RepID=A0A1K0FJW2_9ACTN|nr:NHL domain-containing thioredoxin family protein [Couchioplanes caeruleus]OJF13024.1 alkyl hydroperoxide reductase [Couchioplanes caeruleus subsp. caeruleus]
MMTARVRAPEFRGRGWLNTGGRELTLADLRGRLVVLDFWTFCCINCLHVLDELRPLEEKYGDALVVIGVHSPKFEHERDPVALAAAVERYGVHHPVLDDADMVMWQQYAAKAWPTLSVIDPEGYVVASMAGEGHAEGLSRLLDELIATHEAKGTLRRGDGPYVAATADDTLLRFPGKVIELPSGNLLVSDSARHSVAELTPDGDALVRRIGTGERGRADGPADRASFSEPQGLCLLPDGRTVVVADTVNHLLRGVDLESGEVRTLAGTGRQWRSVDDDGVSLSSPWDVAWFSDRVVVAMAGIHQLWWFDPASGDTGVYAGTTVESLRDGPIPDVWMAQPSGLSAYGEKLWIADSETSALRWIEAGELHTAAGQGLFDFGHVDGAGKEALLQHPLGVGALPDGSVLVADTYNGAVRRYDPATDEMSTVDSGLAEPSDVLVTRAGDVFVVESGAHRLVRLAPGTVKTVEGERHRTERPPSPLAPGEVTLDVVFTPAPGQKLDTTYGPSTRLVVSAAPPELLLEGEGTGTALSRRLVLNPAVPQGILQVVAQAATCDADVEHAACHLTRQDWGVPVVVDPTGPDRLPLILRGLDA